MPVHAAALMLAGIAAASAPSRAVPESSAWQEFLENPNAVTYERLAGSVRDCRDSVCREGLTPDSPTVVRLVALVNRGQPQAIDAAFLGRGLLDGGDLEDVDRSLGEVADRSPRVFLEGARRHRLQPRQLSGIVKMLPSHVIDDDAARVRATEKRIAALSSVDDLALRAERDEALRALRRNRR
jgi:hypothetical protein